MSAISAWRGAAPRQQTAMREIGQYRAADVRMTSLMLELVIVRCALLFSFCYREFFSSQKAS